MKFYEKGVDIKRTNNKEDNIMAELTPVQRANDLVKGGRTEAEQKRIRDVINEYAKRDRSPDLSLSEISALETAFRIADLRGNTKIWEYDDEEVGKAEKYLKADLQYIEYLFSVICDFRPSNFRREEAVKDLAKMTRPDQIEYMIDAFMYLGNTYVLEVMVDAFVNIGEPMVQPLIDELFASRKRAGDSRDYGNEAMAIEILVKINDKRSIEPLKKYVASRAGDENLQKNLWVKVVKAGIFSGINDSKEKEKLKYYARMYSLILASDSRDSNTCGDANNKLGEFKDPFAAEALIENLKKSYWQSPGRAAISLAKTKDPRSLEELVKALKYDGADYQWSFHLHYGVINALEMLGDKKAIPFLIEYIKTDDIQEKKISSAIKTVWKLGGKDLIPQLQTIMKDSKHDSVKKTIAEILVETDDRKAKEEGARYLKESADKTENK